VKGGITIAKVDPRFEREVLRWMLRLMCCGTVRMDAPWRGYP
jgi:hypothetical protein